MSGLLSPDDQRLNLRSDEIPVIQIKTKEIQNIIDEMISIAKGERDEDHSTRRTMVGLAAPQIGKLIRIIIIDTAANPEIPNFKPNLQVFINPRIVNSSKTKTLGREGCYSTGQICGRVWRADKVTIEALDPEGCQITHSSANSFQSRILQHEIDHLDGVRFPQRIQKATDLLLVKQDEFGEFRTHWKEWTKTASWEDWLKLIN